MSLTEIFRPTTRAELIGNSKAVAKLEECILSNRVCILYGDAGLGKTSAVGVIAHDLGWQTREWNASDSRKKEDFIQIIRELKNRSFSPTIFILDEIDGAVKKKDDAKDKVIDYNSIAECLKNTHSPLVLICNDLYQVPKPVTDLCEKIRFYPPTVAEVSQVIRRIEQASGMKADYSRISHDIRNSILNCFYGSSSYHSQTIFEEVEEYFKSGNTKQLTSDHYIWLLDNGCTQFKGRKMFEFYNLLDVCDRIGNFKPLSIMKGGKETVEYPRFIKRAKVLRGKKDV